MAKKEIIATRIYPSMGAEQEGNINLLKEMLQASTNNQGEGPVQPACIMAFDKPLHMTSFQLVAKVRWLMTKAMGGRKIKVGHAGTLDPLASGVMVVCTGRATKLIEQLQRPQALTLSIPLTAHSPRNISQKKK